MTEPGLSDIYDLFYPSPPTLKDLASIEVAVDLWRRKIIGHRTNNTLDELDLKSNLPLSTLIPNMPSVYLTNIEKFAVRVGPSIKSWLKYHSEKKLFGFEILANFVDFVCDFDGKIHYKRTAKRMMLCKWICDDVKFEIACQNCFEDEILKIWPSVESRVNVKKMKLWEYPQICYWVYRLKNQLNELQGSSGGHLSLDEKLLEWVSDYWPSVEYFLNRLNSDTRSIQIYKLFLMKSGSGSRFSKSPWDPCRHLLTKLNDRLLQGLLETGRICRDLIFHSLRDFSRYKVEVEHVLRTWSYIKNITPAEGFVTLVYAILSDHICNESHSKEDYPSLCEIWTSAPNHLKQAVLSSILVDGSFLRVRRALYSGECGEFGGFVTFLWAILSEASVADRKKFWKKNWRMLVRNKKMTDLQRLANLCFSDQTKLEQFKLTQMSKYEKIKEYCAGLIYHNQIEVLNEFLQFCCNDDERTVNDLKLQILTDDINFHGIQISKPSLFNKFIEDAYGPNVRFACHLKRLLWNEGKPYIIKRYLRCGEFKKIRQFVNAFAVNLRRADEFKDRHIVHEIRSLFKSAAFGEMSKEAGDDLAPFMSWLLRSDDKTAEFKETLSVDDIVDFHIAKQSSLDKFTKDDLGRRIRRKSTKTCNYFFIKFLEWYFVTDEALEQFKAKYADDYVFVELTTM